MIIQFWLLLVTKIAKIISRGFHKKVILTFKDMFRGRILIENHTKLTLFIEKREIGKIGKFFENI